MNLIIREERVGDYQITEEVIEKAFKGMELSDQTEHELVAKLRKTDAFIPKLSLVAVDEETNELIGHILLSKVKIQGDNESTIRLRLHLFQSYHHGKEEVLVRRSFTKR